MKQHSNHLQYFPSPTYIAKNLKKKKTQLMSLSRFTRTGLNCLPPKKCWRRKEGRRVSFPDFSASQAYADPLHAPWNHAEGRVSGNQNADAHDSRSTPSRSDRSGHKLTPPHTFKAQPLPSHHTPPSAENSFPQHLESPSPPAVEKRWGRKPEEENYQDSGQS